jgi:hypothetical protein
MHEVRSIWVGIHPRTDDTRILAMAGAGKALLKARLARAPSHPRALPTLLEAVALWQGAPVRAAVVMPEEPATPNDPFYRDLFLDYGMDPLFTVDFVGALRPPREGDGIPGMGQFRDLRQMLLFEVAR